MPGTFEHKGLQLQDRDLSILRGLLDSRLATLQHLSLLYFEGRIEAARKRVQKLKGAGLIHERPRGSTEPAIYCLSRGAFRVLERRGILAEYPKVGWSHLEKRARVSELTLRHELAVMDVRAALSSVAVSAGHRIVEFATWPKLFQFVVRQPGVGDVLVKPDGFVRIQHRGARREAMYFLEVDRSTETLEILTNRAACYREFYERGGFASRFGQPRSEFKRCPFIVLMTFKTTERRNNIAEQLLGIRPPIRNQVWLSTLSEVITDPLGAIWVKPGEYQKVINLSRFDVGQRTLNPRYRSRPAREAFIEQHLAKHYLMPPANLDPDRAELGG